MTTTTTTTATMLYLLFTLNTHLGRKLQ